MHNFHQHIEALLVLLFFTITFSISVIEKVVDWKGTITYYKNHFKNTILQKIIAWLLLFIVAFETIAVCFLIVGIYFLIAEGSNNVAKIGLLISALVLLQFLVGQRIVKDYAGAMSITVYFILNILGIYLLK